MKEETYIYALVDPTTNEIRYVGKSNDPNARLRRHIKDGADRKKTDHKSNWIAKLSRIGCIPRLEILEICNHNEWKRRECFWIDKLRSSGYDLTNSKNGGNGLELTEEARKKMSAARIGVEPHNKGKKTPKDVRKKQSDSAKKRWRKMSQDEKDDIIKNLTSEGGRPGWNHTDEAKGKISKSLIGNKRTLGRKQLESEKKKRSMSLTGHIVGSETRKKIGAANRSLSDDQLKDIMVALKTGEKQTSIARRFGVSKATISGIKLGKIYKSYE